MRIIGTNFHIIHENELRKIREIETNLKRRFTPAQIEALRDGKIQLRKNPKKKAAA